jgi:two-component system, NtrC family, sensor kinase
MTLTNTNDSPDSALLASDTEHSSLSADLIRTQKMLIQQEKLASIGQLAAGVAHEINNPISYVQSNLNTLDRYAKSVKQFLDLVLGLRAVESSSERDELCRKIDDFRAHADIDFVLQEITALTGESLHGVERVRQIVSDLKSFCRSDDTAMQEVEIPKCIESALTIVWNEVKYRAVVIKEYDDVPPVLCYSRQLTQVFINLFINAAQSITGNGEIRVRVSPGAEGRSVIVTVSDSGAGIAPEHLPRIFDPFFTTKDVGKGTGLGLSIVHGIIQRHGGTITAENTGHGACFTISLPTDLVVASLSGIDGHE